MTTDSRGVQWDHVMVSGMAWGPHEITVKDDGVAMDLTGATVYGQVIDRAGANLADIDIVVTDAAAGEFTAALDGDVVAALPQYGATLILALIDATARPVELTRGSVTRQPGAVYG